ncbi:hypothetical protein QUF72_04075 [Desulfobacterales bacterium HSG2]|nr:hypothetical protein [Desulfobacterales bacterium HSG2]
MKEKKEKKKDNETVEIGIDTHRMIRNLFIFCIAFEIFLVILDAFINYGKFTDIGGIRRFCNIAREDSLASWFGTTQTFMVGLTVWMIALIVKHTSASKKQLIGWCVIAAFFTYMAIDDGSELHERMGSAFKAIAKRGDDSWMTSLLSIFPSYAWQIVFAPFFGIMGVFIAVFLWRELTWEKTRIFIILALTCFVIAVGLDFIEGLDKKHEWNIHTLIRKKFELRKYTVRHFGKSFEEFIEMVGTTLFWTAFLSHLSILMHKGVRFFSTSPKLPSEPSPPAKS